LTEPFFTIAIPTKNRPERVGSSIKSVLRQTFQDFEVIVCDNSDEHEATLTRAIVDELGDQRVRYIRTSGTLSMPDNWDASIADARGKYVGILTDRSAYRRDALEIAASEIERTGTRMVSWFPDHYDRGADGILSRRPRTARRHYFYTGTILSYFLNGHPKFAPKIIPRLMSGVYDQTILEKIRESAVGRCCPPVSPDYTSGFLMLAHSGWVLMIDEALFVSCGTGNGSAFRQRKALAERFLREINMTWSDIVDHTPSRACFSFGALLNDFLRMRELLPESFPGLKVNRTQYYLGCMYDYVKSRAVESLAEDFRLLMEALSCESADIQREVRSNGIYQVAVALSEQEPRQEPGDAVTVPANDNDQLLRFATVFDALDWSEAHPQDPAPQSFLDFLPSYADAARPPKLRARKVPRRTLAEIQRDESAAPPRATLARKKPTGIGAVRRRIVKESRHQVIVWRTRARRAQQLAMRGVRSAQQ
jgi:glycosyltransferase involved in cell wall biosynthesis